MKTILTILCILFISLFAQAQENGAEVQVLTPPERVVFTQPIITTLVNSKETKVARLYMDRNYKVKKELSFTTAASKSKLA